jgi:hypothetical protein
MSAVDARALPVAAGTRFPFRLFARSVITRHAARWSVIRPSFSRR